MEWIKIKRPPEDSVSAARSAFFSEKKTKKVEITFPESHFRTNVFEKFLSTLPTLIKLISDLKPFFLIKMWNETKVTA